MWSDLFSCVPGVLEYNSELLKQIRVRVKDTWHYEQKIGDVFVAASSKLANYTNYVNNYHKGMHALLFFRKREFYSRKKTNTTQTALSALHQCQKISAFTTICQDAYNNSKMRLTLGDLLIIPIQRIPRFSSSIRLLVIY